MANHGGEYEGPRRRDPYIGATTSSSHLNGSGRSKACRKASEYFGVSVLLSYNLRGLKQRAVYFSSIVLVLVTTSPYKMLFPNPSLAS